MAMVDDLSDAEDNASLTNVNVGSRRCRRHIVLEIEINHDSKHASFHECTCPSCMEQLSSRDDIMEDNGIYLEDDLHSLGGISEEEAFEARSTSKAGKKSGRRGARPKHVNKGARRKASKPLKPREAHKREIRQQQKAEERTAKEAIWEANRPPPPRRVSAFDAGEYGSDMQNDYYSSSDILTAEVLGMEDEAMYERLMQIAMDGDDITPEDYDILLQLDSKNSKTTMEASELDQYELLIVGKGHGQVSAKSLGTECCLICLESFTKLEAGSELRRLPCQHVFCKSCIDQWLKDNSIKCPSLSCFWVPGDGQDNGCSKKKQEIDADNKKKS